MFERYPLPISAGLLAYRVFWKSVQANAGKISWTKSSPALSKSLTATVTAITTTTTTSTTTTTTTTTNNNNNNNNNVSLFYDFTTLVANYKISITTNTHTHNVHTYQNKQTNSRNKTIQCSAADKQIGDTIKPMCITIQTAVSPLIKQRNR